VSKGIINKYVAHSINVYFFYRIKRYRMIETSTLVENKLAFSSLSLATTNESNNSNVEEKDNHPFTDDEDENFDIKY